MTISAHRCALRAGVAALALGACLAAWGDDQALSAPFHQFDDESPGMKRSTSIGASPLWREKMLNHFAFSRCHPAGGRAAAPQPPPRSAPREDVNTSPN